MYARRSADAPPAAGHVYRAAPCCYRSEFAADKRPVSHELPFPDPSRTV
jgi:hypothetical protein